MLDKGKLSYKCIAWCLVSLKICGKAPVFHDECHIFDWCFGFLKHMKVPDCFRRRALWSRFHAGYGVGEEMSPDLAVSCRPDLVIAALKPNKAT